MGFGAFDSERVVEKMLILCFEYDGGSAFVQWKRKLLVHNLMYVKKIIF